VTRQEQVAFYAAEDAIKRISELEAANAKLSKDLASHQLQNTETQMLQVPQKSEIQMLQVDPISGHSEYPKYFMSKAPQTMSRSDARKGDTD
jgi:hypothetical protein